MKKIYKLLLKNGTQILYFSFLFFFFLLVHERTCELFPSSCHDNVEIFSKGLSISVTADLKLTLGASYWVFLNL